jgi:cytochrome c peroxidase
MRRRRVAKMRTLGVTAAALPLFLCMMGTAFALDPSEEDYDLKLLGKYLFFDKISIPKRQACASCHTPDAGWTNGTSGTNLKDVAVTGANPHTVGTLKPPSNAYASFAPVFQASPSRLLPSGFLGGNFWNGRAKGNEVAELNVLGGALDRYAKYLGPTADQAHASPFINPVEQGLPDIKAVCEHVRSAKYAPLYSIAYDGAQIDCGADAVTAFGRFAVALAGYQHSSEVNAFDSNRDRALASDSDGKFPLDGLSEQENLGHDLFYSTIFKRAPGLPVTNCAFCHNSFNPITSDGTEPQQLYTDHSFHNIGVPRNTEIPGNPEPNIGLAATSGNDAHTGAHKTPTLRNVDKRRGSGFKKAYTHNGWFKSVESLVHFYNTAVIGGTTATNFGITRCPSSIVTETDALANKCWPAPEATGLLAFGLIGDMRMTADHEAALVAYLKTLTDNATVQEPEPFDLRKFANGQLR